MKLAFIGIGNVGFALADHLQRAGHEIIIASDRDSESTRNALLKNNNFEAALSQEAVDSSDLVLLSTPFNANEAVLKPLEFGNKVLVDCTNPVGPGISHGLSSEVSGSEKVQQWAHSARVVKAFSIYGFENLVDSSFPNPTVKPVMMIAGDDGDAKREVSALANTMGFESLDTGRLDQALHLEHLTLLWVKMVRRDGHHPNFTWAYLEK